MNEHPKMSSKVDVNKNDKFSNIFKIINHRVQFFIKNLLKTYCLAYGCQNFKIKILNKNFMFLKPIFLIF